MPNHPPLPAAAPPPVHPDRSAQIHARVVAERQKIQKRKRRVTVLSNILFYLVMGVIVAASLFYALNHKGAKALLGFSAYIVLTDSMQSELPKGSFVLVRQTDPAAIRKGDDITYFISPTTSVTHRVVDIYENFEGSGQRAFQTQGVENPAPDQNPVYAANVAGVVVFSIPELGAALSYIGQNLWLCALFLALVFALSFALRIFFGEARAERKEENIPTCKNRARTAINNEVRGP